MCSCCSPTVLNAFSHRADGVPFDPFNVDAFRASAWVVVVWTFVRIAGECFKLVEGRYTKRVLAVTLACDLVAGALVVFWLTNFQLVDSQAVVQAMQSFGQGAGGPGAVGGGPTCRRPFCGLVVAALVIDAWTPS